MTKETAKDRLLQIEAALLEELPLDERLELKNEELELKEFLGQFQRACVIGEACENCRA